MRTSRSTFVLLLAAVALAAVTAPVGAQEKEAPPAAPRPKLAVALFHWNVQYIAGDRKSEDAILNDSLRGALEFLDANPEFKADFEIQAWGLEAMAERFPDLLALWKKLAERGQIELIVGHYSDQLFYAYPRRDMERSLELSARVLARVGLSRSALFSGQEMQWAPGLVTLLPDHGYRAIVATSALGYYRDLPEALYTFALDGQEMEVLNAGGRKDYPFLEWAWAFYDDGETFNTFTTVNKFKRVAGVEAKSIARFRDLAGKGFRFVHISELTAALRAGLGAPARLPYVPEANWHMDKSIGPYTWMGKALMPTEEDGRVRALPFQARAEVLLGDVFASHGAGPGWGPLLLSEVSDSSGWRPFPVETEYTPARAAEAVAQAGAFLPERLDAAAEILDDPETTGVDAAGERGPRRLLVRTRPGKGRVTEIAGRPLGAVKEVPAARLSAGFTVEGCPADVRVTMLLPGLHQVDVSVTPPEAGKGKWEAAISFPLTARPAYSPSLAEHLSVEVPGDLSHDPVLPLTNGYIRVGEHVAVIKDCSVRHVAAHWERNRDRIVFREEFTARTREAAFRFLEVDTRRFDPVEVANAINVWPTFAARRDPGQGWRWTRLSPESLARFGVVTARE
ncbi:MAG: hypothetical protein HY719_06085 [Planctomycetes bacterium]|nr:hypothetical protein [Planctomycetota bacterium]